MNERILRHNEAYAAGFRVPPRPEPRRRLVVLTCMDARIDPLAALGLELGEAHILRNAGGIVTDDVIRSITLSQRFLATREVMVIQHTECGLEGISDDELVRELVEETGRRPAWDPGGFDDVEGSVRRSLRALQDSPFLREKDRISGFVLETATGRLHPLELG